MPRSSNPAKPSRPLPAQAVKKTGIRSGADLKPPAKPAPTAARGRKPAEPQPRGKGRPGQSTSVGQQSIIDAARALLKVRTPDGLMLKDVAAQAGVDAALIRYYFGNREGLLTATVARMMEERQAVSRGLLKNEWSSEKRLRERLSTVLLQQVEEPNFHRLVVEQLFSQQDEQAHKAVETIAARGLALEVDLLSDSNGQLRAVDPRFLNICILGLCEFFATSQPLVEALFGGRPVDQKLVNAYLDFLVDLLLNGLLKREP